MILGVILSEKYKFQALGYMGISLKSSHIQNWSFKQKITFFIYQERARYSCYVRPGRTMT